MMVDAIHPLIVCVVRGPCQAKTHTNKDHPTFQVSLFFDHCSFRIGPHVCDVLGGNTIRRSGLLDTKVLLGIP
jgi:hypothetical protein